MARLIKRVVGGEQIVFDVTTEPCHSFFAFSGGVEAGILVHNSHQLSSQALDALLKPLEENFEDTPEKKLVCIFCTTEPEKMRATIFSRCAPAFIIQPVNPVEVAGRLTMVCDKEQIEYEPEMLLALAEMTECHIRDALKAVEGISMLGGITRENVISYLHLDLNSSYLDVLEALGTDLGKAMETAHQILLQTSPAICYKKLAETAMMAFASTLGNSHIPVYLDVDRVRALGKSQGNQLLGVASRLASRPMRPTEAMLLCDLGVLHHGGGAIGNAPVVFMPQGAVPKEGVVVTPEPKTSVPSTPSRGTLEAVVMRSGEPVVGRGAVNDGTVPDASKRKAFVTEGLDVTEFAQMLGRALQDELKRVSVGSTRHSDVGGN